MTVLLLEGGGVVAPGAAGFRLPGATRLAGLAVAAGLLAAAVGLCGASSAGCCPEGALAAAACVAPGGAGASYSGWHPSDQLRTGTDAGNPTV